VNLREWKQQENGDEADGEQFRGQRAQETECHAPLPGLMSGKIVLQGGGSGRAQFGQIMAGRSACDGAGSLV
jgi:hypothetical protein